MELAKVEGRWERGKRKRKKYWVLIVVNMAEEVKAADSPDKLLSQRIEKANELLERCENLKKTIEGLSKLRRKILAELKFLKSVST